MQDLNQKQSEFLSNYLFDISKGLVLGSIGFYTLPISGIDLFLRAASVIVALMFAYLLVLFGLNLLK